MVLDSPKSDTQNHLSRTFCQSRRALLWYVVPRCGRICYARPTPCPALTASCSGPRYRYEGSWTAPPCTEGVTWYVGQGSRGISGPNLDLLASVEGRNDRPTQHLNGRTISLVVPRVPN
eukprot:2255211-Rhodomonas_salina.1